MFGLRFVVKYMGPFLVLQSFQMRRESWFLMEGEKRHYSMHTSLFLYVGNFILFCKLCHYIM